MLAGKWRGTGASTVFDQSPRAVSGRWWLALVGVLALGTGSRAQAPEPRFVRHDEIRPVLEVLASRNALASPTLAAQQAESAWAASVRTHDASIRARLLQGDEDTLISWLLLGTSFTSLPRVEVFASQPGLPAPGNAAQQTSQARVTTLISGRTD